MKQPTQLLAMSSLIGSFALITGVATVMQTDLGANGATPIGGLYQRSVEARFSDNIPFRDLSIHSWNAVKLGLFGQPSEGAFIADSGRMFTTEELVEPQSQFDLHTELLAAKSTLDAHGVTLIPVIVPDKARIYANDLGFERTENLVARYTQIQRTVDASGLKAVDLRDSLFMGQFDHDVFMWTDTHWSPYGARLAAQEVARHIDSFELDRTEFRTSADPAIAFEGDLVSFAETGPFREWVGPVAETIVPYQTDATELSSDLFADIEVPIALIGTSFSARTEFNFEGFLKQATGLDLINYAQSGHGPFKPMRDFLSSDALMVSPPQIVVWEIPERYIPVKDPS